MEYRHHYYVVYQWVKDGHNGSGSLDLHRQHKINTLKEIESVRKFVTERNGFDSVIILNYKRVRG